MRYGKIPEKVLKINLYETYDEDTGFKDITVRDCLERVGEDIICSDYKTEIVEGKLTLTHFTAWTRYTVFQLVYDGLDKLIIGIPRHPYSFIYQKR